jgi:hypothetical protein
MATTQNTFTGNGSTVLFSFTFPYLDSTDILVSVNGTLTTAYTLANATTIQFTTAPANGAAIRIFRVTDDATLAATFYPGSSIRSQDLNENFTQNLYATQESNRDATTAISTANGAVTTANTALSNSTAATSTANTASANASAAVSTANTANSNASAAVSTANTASSNASAAVSTANAAAVDAATAISTANGAVSTANAATSTANTALSNSTAAVSTANTASSNASAAVSTANTASSNASTAVSTANSALSTANTALSNSSTAISTANSASAAVASAVIYQPVVDLTALGLLTPADGDFFELQDSTGADTDPAITGVPGGLVGAPGLTFRLRYDDPPQEFVFLGYFANDSETRYLKFSGGTMTGALVVPLASAATPSLTFTGDLDTGVFSPGANQVAVATNGAGRLYIASDGKVGIGTGAPAEILALRSSSSAIQIDTKRSDTTYGNAAILLGSPRSDTADGSTVAGRGLLSCLGNSTNTTGIVWLQAATASLATQLTDTDLKTKQCGIRLASDGSFEHWSSGSQRLKIDSSGRLLIGTSSNLGNSEILQVNSTSPANVAGIYRQANDVTGPRFILGKSRGSVTSIVQNGDIIADIRFVASDGVDIVSQAASITAFVDGTPGADDMPGRLVFSTTADGASTPTERLRITSAGNVGIGTTNPSQKLQVSGNTSIIGGGYLLMQNTNRIQWGSSNTAYIAGQEGGSGYLALGTVGTERARIDSSGRLLVGTSTALTAFFGTPVNKLAIGGGAAPQVIGCYAANQFGPRLDFIKSRSATVNGQAIVSIGDGLGELYFGGSDGTAPIPAARIICQVDGTPGTNDMPGRLMFDITADGASSPTERMRISSDGNCTSFTSSNNTIRTARTSAADSAFVILNGASSVSTGTAVAIIRADGDLENTNNSYGALSDLKLKENIVDATSQWDDLKALQVRKYNFKEDTGYATHTQIGLIAQEVALVSPGLVSESPDRDDEGNDLGTVTKSVNYSVLYMKAVKALQEAMERIEQLETEMAEVKAQLS